MSTKELCESVPSGHEKEVGSNPDHVLLHEQKAKLVAGAKALVSGGDLSHANWGSLLEMAESLDKAASSGFPGPKTAATYVAWLEKERENAVIIETRKRQLAKLEEQEAKELEKKKLEKLEKQAALDAQIRKIEAQLASLEGKEADGLDEGETTEAVEARRILITELKARLKSLQGILNPVQMSAEEAEAERARHEAILASCAEHKKRQAAEKKAEKKAERKAEKEAAVARERAEEERKAKEEDPEHKARMREEELARKAAEEAEHQRLLKEKRWYAEKCAYKQNSGALWHLVSVGKGRLLQLCDKWIGELQTTDPLRDTMFCFMEYLRGVEKPRSGWTVKGRGKNKTRQTFNNKRKEVETTGRGDAGKADAEFSTQLLEEIARLGYMLRELVPHLLSVLPDTMRHWYCVDYFKEISHVDQLKAMTPKEFAELVVVVTIEEFMTDPAKMVRAMKGRNGENKKNHDAVRVELANIKKKLEHMKAMVQFNEMLAIMLADINWSKGGIEYDYSPMSLDQLMDMYQLLFEIAGVVFDTDRNAFTYPPPSL